MGRLSQHFHLNHLLVGLIVDPQIGRLENLVKRLIKVQRPNGAFEVTVAEENDGPVLHCAFERADDADKFATAVHATLIGRYQGWVSQREFVLNAPLAKTMRVALLGSGADDLQELS